MFIDEAQNLSVPLLEEIRILSDSDGRERQLQVVLVGQPELRDKLHLPEMRQVAQRISVRCLLTPLTCDGVEGYVAHRLHVAGGAPDRVRFSREAIDVIFEASQGVPRVINRLCDRALHHGHVERRSVIDAAAVALACADMEITPPHVNPASSAPAADSTEMWFSETDACVQDAADNEPMEVSDLTAPVAERPMFSMHQGRRASGPATRMERLRRRWMRRIKITVLLLSVLGGARLVGESVVLKSSWRRRSCRKSLPLPRLRCHQRWSFRPFLKTRRIRSGRTNFRRTNDRSHRDEARHALTVRAGAC